MWLQRYLASLAVVLPLVAAYTVLDSQNGIACELLKAPEPIKLEANGAALVVAFRLKNHDEYHLPSATEYRVDYQAQECDFNWHERFSGIESTGFRIEDLVDSGGRVTVLAKDILEGDDSGIICVAASQITDETREVKVHFGSGLTWTEKRYAKVLAVVVIVGWLMAAFLRRHIKQYRGVSLVLEGVIHYVLLPLLIAVTVRWLWLFLRGVISISLDLWLALAINQITLKAMEIARTMAMMLLYLFCCGYGTLYYIKGDHPEFQRMPDNLWLWGRSRFIWLVALIMIMPLTDVLALPVKLFVLPVDASSMNVLQAIASLFYGMIGFVVWCKAIFNFFKTSRQLRQFPDAVATGNGDEIAAKFNKLMMVVLVFPMVLGILGVILVVPTIALVDVGSMGDPAALFEKLWSSRGWAAMLVVAPLSTLVEVAVVYYLWVRDNHGLVLQGDDTVFAESSVDH